MAAWSTPRLTYVDLNLDACGRAALDYIAAKSNGTNPDPKPIMPPRLFRSRAGDPDGRADIGRAKAMFGISILYLFLLFAALLLERALPLYLDVRGG